MTSQQFSTWERELFHILADPNSTHVDITAVLAATPSEVSETVHRIAVKAMELEFPELPADLPDEFKNATQVADTREVLEALAFSQNPETWSTAPELFAKHMDLADELTNETNLMDEKEFLMFAWDILSDVREHLEGMDTDAIDFERFDYFVNHIEEIASM